MCNNCNCDNYEKCSIVGYLPVGYCCSYCIMSNAKHTCLTTINKPSKAKKAELPINNLIPIKTTIEDGLLKVVFKQEDKEIPLYIDIKKQLSQISNLL